MARPFVWVYTATKCENRIQTWAVWLWHRWTLLLPASPGTTVVLGGCENDRENAPGSWGIPPEDVGHKCALPPSHTRWSEKLVISLHFSSQINSSSPFTKTVSTSLLWKSPHPFSSTQGKDLSFLNSGVRREKWETPLAGDSEIWKHAIELWHVGVGVLCFSCLKLLTFSFLNLAKKQGSWKDCYFSMLKNKCFFKKSALKFSRIGEQIYSVYQQVRIYRSSV